jgi:L,D-transpeptidase ErfK/SrfK
MEKRTLAMKKIIFSLLLVLAASFGSAEAQQYYGRYLCSYAQFNCVRVKKGDTWHKLFPNAYQREMVMRLNRTNIPLYFRSWIVVPANVNKVSYLDLAPFPLHIQSSNEKLIVVNIAAQAFAAYNPDGNLVHWGPISAGRDWCEDIGRPCKTATGSFRIFRKQGPECKSTKFPVETDGGAPMPYCMYYLKGFALHGSSLPGFHASHGCVRLFNNDAAWLNEHFISMGTKIIVTHEKDF